MTESCNDTILNEVVIVTDGIKYTVCDSGDAAQSRDDEDIQMQDPDSDGTQPIITGVNTCSYPRLSHLNQNSDSNGKICFSYENTLFKSIDAVKSKRKKKGTETAVNTRGFEEGHDRKGINGDHDYSTPKYKGNSSGPRELEDYKAYSVDSVYLEKPEGCIRDIKSPCPDKIIKGLKTPSDSLEPVRRSARKKTENHPLWASLIKKPRRTKNSTPSDVQNNSERTPKQKSIKHVKHDKGIKETKTESASAHYTLKATSGKQQSTSKNRPVSDKSSRNKIITESKAVSKLRKRSVKPETKFSLCPLCVKMIHVSDMLEHFKTCAKRFKIMHSGQNGNFICKVCSKELSCWDNMVDHYSQHRAESGHRCSLCKKKVIYEAMLDRSRHQCTDNMTRDHLCDVCGKGFTSIGSLRNHKKTHGKINGTITAYPCPECGRKFSQKGNMKTHLRLHREEGYMCDECDAIFCQRIALGYHHSKIKEEKDKLEKDSSDIKIKTCNYCNAKFKYNTCFKHHIMTEREKVIKNQLEADKELTCPKCSKLVPNIKTLRVHIRMHDNNVHKHQTCPVCGKLFRNNLLKRHMMVHTGQRPFQCQYCEKSFAQKNNLKDHERIHTREFPFKCHLCGKCFTQSSNMNVHVKRCLIRSLKKDKADLGNNLPKKYAKELQSDAQMNQKGPWPIIDAIDSICKSKGQKVGSGKIGSKVVLLRRVELPYKEIINTDENDDLDIGLKTGSETPSGSLIHVVTEYEDLCDTSTLQGTGPSVESSISDGQVPEIPNKNSVSTQHVLEQNYVNRSPKCDELLPRKETSLEPAATKAAQDEPKQQRIMIPVETEQTESATKGSVEDAGNTLALSDVFGPEFVIETYTFIDNSPRQAVNVIRSDVKEDKGIQNYSFGVHNRDTSNILLQVPSSLVKQAGPVVVSDRPREVYILRSDSGHVIMETSEASAHEIKRLELTTDNQGNSHDEGSSADVFHQTQLCGLSEPPANVYTFVLYDNQEELHHQIK